MAGLQAADQAKVDQVVSDLLVQILAQTTIQQTVKRGYDRTEPLIAGDVRAFYEVLLVAYQRARDSNNRIAVYQMRLQVAERLTDPYDDTSALMFDSRDLEVLMDPTLYEGIANVVQVEDQPERSDPERDGDVITYEVTAQFTVSVGGPA